MSVIRWSLLMHRSERSPLDGYDLFIGALAGFLGGCALVAFGVFYVPWFVVYAGPRWLIRAYRNRKDET